MEKLVRAFAPAWIARPGGPARAVVALTRRCNLRCAMCHTASLEPGREMSPDEVNRLFWGMPRLAWLDLTGGEPFLRGDVAEVFDAVLSATPSLAVLHFPTNGWYLDRVVACATMVRERRPEVSLMVTVSIDGPRAVHDRVRDRAGSFDRAVRTLHQLRRIPGVQVYAGTTVGPWNRDSLPELHSFLSREFEGFDERMWHWNQVQESGHFFGNEGVGFLDPVDAAELVREHFARRWPPGDAVDLMELAYLANVHDYLLGNPVGMDCQALHTSCFVSADAILYPCHVWDRPLVDLRANGLRLDTAWSAPDVVDARRQAVALDCGGCFTPCEAYTTLAGSPLRAALLTAIRTGRLASLR